MKPYATWTDDCNGKKDYDGPIVDITTRYWPPGGGFMVFDTREPEKGLHEPETTPGAQASATSTIRLLWLDTGVPYHDYVDRDLVSADFEGATFEEVAAKVEAWAEAQMGRVAKALQREFSEDEPASEGA